MAHRNRHRTEMNSSRPINKEPIGTPADNATAFQVRPRELGVATADAPRRVAVDIHLPVKVQIRTPKRTWRFEILADDRETIAYVGVGERTSRLEDPEPQCVPGWMPAVAGYIGFEIADSGVKR